MKKTILSLIGALTLTAISAQSYVSLAEWTFDGWLPGKILPPNATAITPLSPDRGTEVNMQYAKLEGQTYVAGREPSEYTHMNWSAASAGGYTRTTGGESSWNLVGGEAYYIMAGINTLGHFNTMVSANFCTSGNGDLYHYSMKGQYRLGAEGKWVDFCPEFTITLSSESNWIQGPMDVKLPTECNGVAQVDIRWLCTSPASNTGTQYRIKNFVVKALPNATTPTIYRAFNEINFGEVPVGESKTVTVDVIGRSLSPMSAILTATTEAPFSITTKSFTAMFGTVTKTTNVIFTPTAEGLFSKAFVISGGTAPDLMVAVSGSGTGASSVDKVQEVKNVFVMNGQLVIVAEKIEKVIITDIAGRVVKELFTVKGTTAVELSRGKMYIVRIEGKTKKVVL